MKQNKLYSIIIIKIIYLIFGLNVPHITQHYLTTFNTFRKRNGIKFTIKYFKAVKLHITRYICGQPLKVNLDVRIGLSNGFPTKFLYLKDLIDTCNIKVLRVILTLLTFTRTVEPTKKESKSIKVDYSSIVLPNKSTKRIFIPS
jgi:hypothetical protein